MKYLVNRNKQFQWRIWSILDTYRDGTFLNTYLGNTTLFHTTITNDKSLRTSVHSIAGLELIGYTVFDHPPSLEELLSL